MAKISNHVFSTNSRVIKDFLTHYKNTFYAFCELLNNSIQANSTVVDIKIEYATKELTKAPIKSITVKDNGNGVSLSDFDKKILEIGTDVKKGGQGVGRFAALQIGCNIEIETVAYDDDLKKYYKVKLPINSSLFENRKLVDMKFPVTEEILTGKHNSYYQVSIKGLHHNQHTKTDRKNVIAKELLEENIRLSLFERYPYEIFNETVKFSLNKKKLTKSEFAYDTPVLKAVTFTDVKGNEHPISFQFYKVKLNDNKAKVFFQVNNNGLKTVVNTYTYSSEWFTQEMGSWFIYIDSPLFSWDLFKNIDMDELGDEGIDKLKSFAKDIITDFFISINKNFETFTHKLRDSYPVYFDDKNAASETQKIVFEQFAYI